MDGDQFGRLIYLALLLAALGGWVLVEYRQRMAFALRSALAWGMIFVGIIAGYGLWHDIRRDIRPEQQIAGQEIVIPKARDGHYYVMLTVNGTEVQMMADTGASGIALSPSVAKSLGINTDTLAYTGQAVTANGTVRTAQVRLDDVSLGPYSDKDVRASVTEGAMDISLLGMDYLGLYSIQIEGDRMVLNR